MNDNYLAVAVLVGGVTFIATWIFCAIKYGFLLGVGLGWLPAVFCGVIAGVLWPIPLLLLALGAVLFLRAA